MDLPMGQTNEINKYKSYGAHNFRKIPQVMERLSKEQLFDIEVVASVLPFKANNYVVNELINWDNAPDDPIFRLVFPQKEMLSRQHFDRMAKLIRKEVSKTELKKAANEIRIQLNPHPAGQMEHNVPTLEGVKLTGIQHKYRESILYFPSQGQTCHAYCTFCFRWPQFVGMDELKFAMRETEMLVKYVKSHPEVSDVLFTGGDPMIMKAERFESYVNALLEADMPNLKTIRIGSKSLGYWPYKFSTDKDADLMLRIFERIVKSGVHLSFMAHFNHPVEQQTPAVQEAVRRILATGAQIRTQSPLMRNINDSAEAWQKMWIDQVHQGMIPYYMFLARDTGAHDYFAVPLGKALSIYNDAISGVSGIGRTVRGPSMSADPGKVQVVGASEIKGEKVFALKFLQGRNPEWIKQVFYAKYDPEATWLDELTPAFGDKGFFFEPELEELFDNEKFMDAVEPEYMRFTANG
ncbi:MAG TPA: lysine 2,3-aminomutase [Cytophagales bacterium]|nr:lysine 2,3-aminomutase [Cytophagales bacterium]